jgi:hypothetical protein
MFRAALVALSLLSCADDAIWWELPPDMTDEERADFGEACERWNYVAIRQQYVQTEAGGTHRVFMRLPEHLVRQIDVDGDGHNDVRGEVGGHTLNLVRGMDRRTFAMVATHKLGHALGLDHVEQPGVMNKQAGQIEFSEADLAKCRRVNACR